MNPSDIIKIATSAGLGKDVIDLLEKKLSLLSGEMSALEKQLDSLKQENTKLKVENSDLQKKLKQLEEKKENQVNLPDGFDDDSLKILELMFEHPRAIDTGFISSRTEVETGIVKYHLDVLKGCVKMASPEVNFGRGRRNPATYELTPSGRALYMKLKKKREPVEIANT